MGNPNHHPDIIAAIEAAGGSQAELAKRCGCVQQTISKLLNRQIDVTGEMAIAIEAATEGKVSRFKLRPDLWPTPNGVAA